MSRLVLASSSPYRRQLLDRLGLDYHWQAPDIDETALPREPAADLALRLAEQKARALAEMFPDHLIIGSDQVCILDSQLLAKPGSFAKAQEQLFAASGRSLVFYTGLCLLNTHSWNCQNLLEPYTVVFRDLSQQQIDNYLRREQPFDCAGSFKAEGLGISLFKRLEGRDPNALIGLPLIGLIDLLEKEGISVL